MSCFFSNSGSDFTGKVYENESLKRHTYYRIGGPARFLLVPESGTDLEWISQGLKETGEKFFTMGSGSNLLVPDEGFDGVVIKTSKLNREIAAAENEVTVGASVALMDLVRRVAKEGWHGLEFLVGIPGSAGGAAFMNAGTHLGESKDALLRVKAFDLKESRWIEFEKDEMAYSYRKNEYLPSTAVVYSTTWAMKKKNPREVEKTIQDAIERRKQTQPVEHLSCGSVFKNPKEFGLRAWEVVEKLGLRGHQIGGAQFSEKHPNFIVNRKQARFSDVKGLIDLAKSRAREELGVVLEEEVRYLRYSG